MPVREGPRNSSVRSPRNSLLSFQRWGGRSEKRKRKAKYALFAAAIQEKDSTPLARQPRPTRMGPNLPGPCFRWNQMGRWAKFCPNSWPPTKPCPTCKQWGPWKMDCPQTLPIKSQGPPQTQQQWAGNQTLGGPAPQTTAPRMR